MAVKKADILVEGSTYLLSLAKLTGKKVKDIQGYATEEEGEAAFKLSRIVFEDDTYVRVEGEHDFPYVAGGGDQPGLDQDTLNSLQAE
jgi:hypothetical protein